MRYTRVFQQTDKLEFTGKWQTAGPARGPAVKAIVGILILNFHQLSTAPGDHSPGFQVEQLMANGAVDITVLFCPYYRQQTFFEFHNLTSQRKKRELAPAFY